MGVLLTTTFFAIQLLVVLGGVGNLGKSSNKGFAKIVPQCRDSAANIHNSISGRNIGCESLRRFKAITRQDIRLLGCFNVEKIFRGNRSQFIEGVRIYRKAKGECKK
ncbi:MAG: hypothetical protein COB51_12115 [Moraxellaceae bacterium]|nr:MAG: hypothetical protein COB51_12115 [Moraxellaceae bacterium]